MSNQQFGVYFYKGTHAGLPGVYNRVVRWLDRGPYSHVELAFSDGMSASSSYMDKGVRFKKIDYDPQRWDFIALPVELEQHARQWFEDHLGLPYDIWGNIRFLFGFVRDQKGAWFCSESVCAALGWHDGFRYSPNGFYEALEGSIFDLSGGRHERFGA